MSIGMREHLKSYLIISVCEPWKQLNPVGNIIELKTIETE